MKAVILCPGPSLSLYRPERAADIVIAVNRAAIRCDSTVWACGDQPLFDEIRDQVRGTPSLFTVAANSARLRDHGRVWPGKVEDFESLYDGQEVATHWPDLTLTAAIWYAYRKGAIWVRIYGADWQGEKDWDGVHFSNGNRSPERWEYEKSLVGVLSTVLGGKITIERVLPPCAGAANGTTKAAPALRGGL